jgi:cobalt-zinc-cadmium efflux system outer membrane protein
MKKRRVLRLCLGVFLATTIGRPQENGSITLSGLIQASLDRNREILALRQRIAQTQGLRQQAGVRPALTIEAEGGSGRPLGSVGEQEFTTALIERIETFGKRANRVHIADLSVAMARVELDARSTQIAYDIEVGYLSVVYERERIVVIDRVRENLKESYRLTEARVKEGDAAPLESQLLFVELSRADAQRADATGRLAVAELDFRRLVSLGSTDALPRIASPTAGSAALSLDQLIAGALDKRADVRTARLVEQQENAQVALANSQARPDVTVSARYTYNSSKLDGQYGLTSAGATTPLRDRYNALSVGVSVPLVTKKRNRGALEAASAGAASARLRREYLESTIPLEVQSAWERWSATQRTRDVLRDGVVGQSIKNLAVVREAYQLGQLRLLDVLNEQRRLTEMELSFLDARVQVARALAELERTTGGLLP